MCLEHFCLPIKINIRIKKHETNAARNPEKKYLGWIMSVVQSATRTAIHNVALVVDWEKLGNLSEYEPLCREVRTIDSVEGWTRPLFRPSAAAVWPMHYLQQIAVGDYDPQRKTHLQLSQIHFLRFADAGLMIYIILYIVILKLLYYSLHMSRR